MKITIECTPQEIEPLGKWRRFIASETSNITVECNTVNVKEVVDKIAESLSKSGVL